MGGFTELWIDISSLFIGDIFMETCFENLVTHHLALSVRVI